MTRLAERIEATNARFMEVVERAGLSAEFRTAHCPGTRIAELIGLPQDHVIGPMVAVGRGTKAPWPKPGQLSIDEVVIQNRFSS